MYDQSTEMKDAVLSALKESGKLGKISAEVRAEVYLLLTRDSEKPRSIPLCRENLIINELIREYLLMNGLKNTLSVFVPETGEPIDPIDRNFLAHSLDLTPRETSPLLNSLVRKWRNDELFNSENKSNTNNNISTAQGNIQNAGVMNPFQLGNSNGNDGEINSNNKIETGGFFEINSA